MTFTHTPRKSLKDGYGHRVATKCDGCGEVVMDADPGNAAGIRYAAFFLSRAMLGHQCRAAGVPGEINESGG